MDKVILTGESSTARHDLMLDGVLHHYENRIFPLDKEYLLCMCRDISGGGSPTMGGGNTRKRTKGCQNQSGRVGPAEICFSGKHES